MAKDQKKARARESIPGPRLAKQVPAKIKTNLREDDDSLILRFDQVDIGGPWCLSRARAEHLTEILHAIKNFESMSVNEVFKGYPGKDYTSTDGMSKEARERLLMLNLDDQDISVLRLGGKPRLFGFRHGRFFHVLWWDPEHEVWPSEKKHT